MVHKTQPTHPSFDQAQHARNLMQQQFSPDPCHPLAMVQTSQMVLFYLQKK